MTQFSFAAACGYEASVWEAAEMHRQVALIMENCDDYLVQLPELPPMNHVGRVPSLRVLKAHKAAREAACQPTGESSCETVTIADVRRLKILRRWHCRGNKEVRLTSHSARSKEQTLIPSVVAIAGAASLGLRRRNRHTSEPPRKLASKGALICPEHANVSNEAKSNSQMARMCVCLPGTGLAPKPPAVPRTGPGGRRLFTKQVVHMAAAEVSP